MACPENSVSPGGSDQVENCRCNAGQCLFVDPNIYICDHAHQKGRLQICHLLLECFDNFSLPHSRYIPGYVGNDGDTCTACVPGKFKEDIGSTPCDNCKLGAYSSASSATSKYACTNCSSISSSKSGEGSSTCHCNAGYSGPDLGPCEPCQQGKYKDIPGPAPCQDCPAGTYLDSPGASSPSACVSCPAGSTSLPGSSALKDCMCLPVGLCVLTMCVTQKLC